MSETPTGTPEGTPAPPTPPPAPPASTPPPETDWKAEARKWEERAKANKDAADKLAEIEEASKTEAEKLADRAAAAEAKVAEFETERQIAAWRDEVAEATKVPAAALRGSTKEELEAHAATLTPLITQDGKKGATAPYVPPEGSTAGGALGGPAQDFADHLQSQLGR